MGGRLLAARLGTSPVRELLPGMFHGHLSMLLFASLPGALAVSQLGFAASPGRIAVGRASAGTSASLHAARVMLRPARLGAGHARMMSTPTETEKDSGVVLNPDFTFKMDDIVSVCKRRGFVFQSSEIYNGFNGFYDYGPLGVELKQNIKKIWWRDMVPSCTHAAAVLAPPPLPTAAPRPSRNAAPKRPDASIARAGAPSRGRGGARLLYHRLPEDLEVLGPRRRLLGPDGGLQGAARGPRAALGGAAER